jgi:hypothetical protein
VETLPTGVVGADRLTSIFGLWPSFHDAEVLGLTLDRAEQEGSEHPPPVLTLSVRVFTFGPEVAPTGFYVLHNETLAKLLFGGVCELALEGFNHQNVLHGLNIEDIRDRQLEDQNYAVALSGSFGLEGNFQCSTIEVVSAEPWTGPA